MMQYRVILPTLVLGTTDSHQAAVAIQPGTIIDLIGAAERDDRFVAIRIRGEKFHIFASDLAARMEPIIVRKDLEVFSSTR